MPAYHANATFRTFAILRIADEADTPTNRA
jgi:hypothetical protein